MPQISIIIPAYNNSRYLPECVHSVTHQEFTDLEVIIVDDASTDDTPAVASRLAAEDSRIKFIRHDKNSGTLASRKTGVLSSKGKFVMLMDQDDELTAGALTALNSFAEKHQADIYHFGVQVQAANSSAQQAVSGMSAFLTPKPRQLTEDAILSTQFSHDDGFDWHVHHKMYAGDFARSAYAMAADRRLVLSDDLYMSFILDATASTYIGIPDSPWYIYHLGRGDTLGQQLTTDALETMSQRDAQALSMLHDFVEHNHGTISRSDWNERLTDVQNRLIEHTMNEWKDNLPDNAKSDALQCILGNWSPDTVCGELYRYVRDYAYAYLISQNRSSATSLEEKNQAERYLHLAQRIEQQNGLPTGCNNKHYLELRDIAYSHLEDSGLLSTQEFQKSNKTGSGYLKVMLERLFSRHQDKPVR